MAAWILAAVVVAASLLSQVATASRDVVPLPDPALAETSSLAVTATDPGLLWTAGDSGDLPQLLAINRSGATVGAWWVTGGTNVDWEDLARLPGPEPSLLIADTGDNARRRETVSFLRVPEPFPADHLDRLLAGRHHDVEFARIGLRLDFLGQRNQLVGFTAHCGNNVVLKT